MTQVWTNVGPGRLDRVGEPFEPVTAHDQRILEAPVPELGEDVEPPFGALAAVTDPDPQDVFAALDIHADGDVGGLVDHGAAIADLHHQSVDVQDRIARIEGPVLPVVEFLDDPVGHLRHQRC